MTVYENIHSEPLQDQWLDAYGHLNEAYYLVPFSNASWALQDRFGIGTDYFARTGGAIYTVETHLRYLKEVRAPAVFQIDSMIIAAAPKKLHFAHVMNVDGIERATFECLALHFDSKAGRTAPLPDDVLSALQAAAQAEAPDWIGRKIGI